MSGDRERCLGCGMVAVVTRPIKTEDLLATVAYWMRSSPPLPASTPQVRQDSPANRDPEFLDMFLNDWFVTKQRCAEALHDRDFDGLQSLAHRIKGVLGHLGVDELFECAQEFEMLVEAGELAKVGPSFDRLSELIAAFIAAHIPGRGPISES
jgi:HPt (histidine-containing phosphotransfer) domain-containing protein